MLIRIQPGNSASLFEQIAAQLRAALASGQVAVGERLPPARALAESLDVNMHTVLRAYDCLRNEGLVEMRRGRGVVVIGGSNARARLRALANDLIQEAKKQGLSRDELARLLEKLQ